jgi:hypothetical protein
MLQQYKDALQRLENTDDQHRYFNCMSAYLYLRDHGQSYSAREKGDSLERYAMHLIQDLQNAIRKLEHEKP